MRALALSISSLLVLKRLMLREDHIHIWGFGCKTGERAQLIGRLIEEGILEIKKNTYSKGFYKDNNGVPWHHSSENRTA